jgi:CBS domain containing-hemolysin-like protein
MAEGSDYTTIAGFVLWRLGHIPEANEAFEWEGWRFVVAALEGHRIETITAHPVAEQT